MLVFLACLFILLNDVHEVMGHPSEWDDASLTPLNRKSRSTRVKVFIVNGEDSNKLTWAQAYMYCRSINAQLASFSNTEEYKNLQETIRKLPQVKTSNKRFWIGGGLAMSYEWLWADSGNPITFTPWGQGQPKYDSTCLELSTGSEDKGKTGKHPFLHNPQLYNKPCEKLNNFICHNFS